MSTFEQRKNKAHAVELGATTGASTVGIGFGAAKLRDAYSEDYPKSFNRVVRGAGRSTAALTRNTRTAGRAMRVVRRGKPHFVPLAVATTLAGAAGAARKYQGVESLRQRRHQAERDGQAAPLVKSEYKPGKYKPATELSAKQRKAVLPLAHARSRVSLTPIPERGVPTATNTVGVSRGRGAADAYSAHGAQMLLGHKGFTEALHAPTVPSAVHPNIHYNADTHPAFRASMDAAIRPDVAARLRHPVVFHHTGVPSEVNAHAAAIKPHRELTGGKGHVVINAASIDRMGRPVPQAPMLGDPGGAHRAGRGVLMNTSGDEASVSHVVNHELGHAMQHGRNPGSIAADAQRGSHRLLRYSMGDEAYADAVGGRSLYRANRTISSRRTIQRVIDAPKSRQAAMAGVPGLKAKHLRPGIKAAMRYHEVHADVSRALNGVSHLGKSMPLVPVKAAHRAGGVKPQPMLYRPKHAPVVGASRVTNGAQRLFARAASNKRVGGLLMHVGEDIPDILDGASDAVFGKSAGGQMTNGFGVDHVSKALTDRQKRHAVAGGALGSAGVAVAAGVRATREGNRGLQRTLQGAVAEHKGLKAAAKMHRMAAGIHARRGGKAVAIAVPASLAAEALTAKHERMAKGMPGLPGAKLKAIRLADPKQTPGVLRRAAAGRHEAPGRRRLRVGVETAVPAGPRHLTKAFDSEGSRHQRQNAYAGAAGGGAVVAGAASAKLGRVAHAQRRTSRARFDGSGKAMGHALAAHNDTVDRYKRHLIAPGKPNNLPRTGGVMRQTEAGTGLVHTNLGAARNLHNEGVAAMRSARHAGHGAVAAGVAAGALGVAAAGIARSDRKGHGRTYSYR